jgi:hypothetical protein
VLLQPLVAPQLLALVKQRRRRLGMHWWEGPGWGVTSNAIKDFPGVFYGANFVLHTQVPSKEKYGELKTRLNHYGTILHG